MAPNGDHEDEFPGLNHSHSSGYDGGSRVLTGAESARSLLVVEHPLTAESPSDISIIAKLLFQWIWTITFAVALLIVIKVYDAKAILTPSQKDQYNFWTTGLILFLGLSFFEAFKGLAKALRRHLERHFTPQPKARRLIQEFDSLLKVIQLAFDGTISVGKGLRAFCLFWLLINLIAQIATAVISLTITLDDGKDYNSTYVRSGQVTVSNISCYFHGNDCANDITADALAHAYGDVTLAADSPRDLDCGYFTDVTSVIQSRQNFRYYCRRNTTIQAFAYRFKEYNPNDKDLTYPYFTDRVINASSGRCNEYSQVGKPEPVTVGDTSGLNYISAMKYNYQSTNGTTNGSIVIPTSALGNDGTTYIYRGINIPKDATSSAVRYGDRGIWMWAYRNIQSKNLEPPLFFECPVNVSTVSNVRGDPKVNITDDLAREAAASIALQGQFRARGEGRDFTQWQWYANGHPWEIHGHDNSRVGANIAEHALVSLSQMVARNRQMSINGTLPNLGSKVSVHWRYLEAMLACIFAVDSILIVMSFWATKVVPYP